jgi:hypothetical protein
VVLTQSIVWEKRKVGRTTMARRANFFIVLRFGVMSEFVSKNKKENKNTAY